MIVKTGVKAGGGAPAQTPAVNRSVYEVIAMRVKPKVTCGSRLSNYPNG